MTRSRRGVLRGDAQSAGRRLKTLKTAFSWGLQGEIDYWLGVSEALCGRHAQALAAFARVPPGFPFEPRGAYLEASLNLQRGRLRTAERRLLEVLAHGGDGLNPLRMLLVRVYEIQGRFQDAAGPIRECLAEAPDPVPILSELWSHDQPAIPTESLRAALDDAMRMAPDDDRVWLGYARLALVNGRFDVADYWLRRCLEAPDEAVWLARLDWARGVGRPDEALAALRELTPGRLSLAQQLSWQAWLLRSQGDFDRERAVLERLNHLDPHDRPTLRRLAELATTEGKPDLAVQLRERVAEADQALDNYRRAITGSGPFADADVATRHGSHGGDGWTSLRRACLVHARPQGRSRSRGGRDRPRQARLGLTSTPNTPSLDPWVDLDPVAPRDTPLEVSTHPTFIDDAIKSGLEFTYRNGQTRSRQLPESMGGGLALLDYDRDGWLDVYFVQGGSFPANSSTPPQGGGDRLFRNQGDGSFVDVTEHAGLGGGHDYGFGAAVGDINGDGYPDLFLTRWRSYVLYLNRGDGTFEDVTEQAGLAGDRDFPTSAAFADLDGDGDLDLYVCHYCAWDSANPRICRDAASRVVVSCNPLELDARPDHLFRNDDGHFTDVTNEAGIDDRNGRGLGVVAADLDDDGLIDLFVANDMTANYFWRNLGGLRFEESAHAAGVAGSGIGGYRAGMGVARGDLDRDGHIDVFVTNFFGESTSFYHNLGSGLFAEHSDASGIALASRSLLGFGIVAFDADDDGWLDLATANGHVNDLRPHFPYFMPAQLLQGLGDGRVHDVSAASGPCWAVQRMGRGLAAGDLDNDGRLDLLLVSHNQPAAYFHNVTEAHGHTLTLQLEGRGRNRDAVGARVVVTAGGKRFVADRFGGGSYLSAGDQRLHFGLGNADGAVVEVSWPSGRTERFGELTTDTGYLLREGADRPLPLPGFPRERTGPIGESR